MPPARDSRIHVPALMEAISFKPLALAEDGVKLSNQIEEHCVYRPNRKESEVET